MSMRDIMFDTTNPDNWTPVDGDGNPVSAGSEVPFVYHEAGVRGIFRTLNSAFTKMIFIRTISTQAAAGTQHSAERTQCPGS